VRADVFVVVCGGGWFVAVVVQSELDSEVRGGVRVAGYVGVHVCCVLSMLASVACSCTEKGSKPTNPL
jgi:hypothetical protein